MPVPDPPFSTPRIMKVLEPSAGQYEVVVRMDPTLASKFPDKPFGTDISAIGLAKKDSDKYPGYTLVAIEPADKGGKDHLWIFQKLSGPEWTTTSNSRDNLTPAKYRGQTVVVKTEQEVAPATAPTALTGDLVSSVVTQTPNTGKAVLAEVTETIDENAAALVGQQFAPDGTLLASSESLVDDGTAAEKSVNVAQSTVEPIGNGKSVKQTSTAKKRNTSDATVDGWPKKQKKSKGTENLTPQKYRSLVTTTTTTEQVLLAAADVDEIPAPATPTGNETVIEHEKVNDYRYEKRTTIETITEDAAPLAGQRAYEEREVANTSEELVDDDTSADSGSLIISSSVTPLGNGKSIKETVSVTGWTQHTGSTWNDELQAHVTYTEEFIAASGGGAPDDNTEIKIINADRSLKITKTVPTDAYEDFSISFPITVRIDLPRVLKSVKVVWNEGSDIGQRFNSFGNSASGTSWSLSGDNADTDKSSASLMPEILTEFEDFSTDNLPATAHVFYLPMKPAITVSDILSKVSSIAGGSVTPWPVFRTKSHTIAGLGQSASVVVSTNASNHISWNNQEGVTKSGWQQGYGDDISKNLSNSVAQIAPCIHGAITVEGQTTRTRTVSASASSPIISTYAPPLTPAHARSVTVTASVSPTSLAATTPAAIPITGLFLLDSKVQPHEDGYAKVYVEVFDALNLAPP